MSSGLFLAAEGGASPFPPHHVEQQLREVGEGFEVCFQRPGGWNPRAVHRSAEDQEGRKYPSHRPRVPSALKNPHHLCLIAIDH